VSRKWAKDTGGPAGDECQNLVAVCATCANCAHGYHPGCVGCFDDGSPCGCPCGPETPAADWDAVSATLKGQRGKGGGGIRPEEQLVSPALVSRSSRGHAQPMSAGHHVDGVIEAAFMAEQQIVNALTRDMAGAGGGADDNTAQGGHLIPVDFHMTQDPIHSNGGTPALGRKSGGMGVMASGVRRLTPIEVERLQGLPDGWSAPPGLDAPDSRRYAAVGDAVTANVSQWIGERLLRFG